jgi:hypothetical protein
VLASVLVLIILIWIILLIYVSANEKSLIEKASAIVEKRIHGDVYIGGLSVSFFRTFPLLSLQLEDVELNDSLYPVHRRHLLKASDIYLRASIGGLITNTAPVGRVIIRNAEINLITDAAGNSNEYVLKSTGRGPGESFSMPDVVLQAVSLNYEDPTRKKHYLANVQSLKCATSTKKDRMVFKINLRMLVKNLAFNTKQGSYLANKPVSGKFDLVYLPATKDVIADHITLNLDGHAYKFNGTFNTDNNKADFRLNITTNNEHYGHATSLLREPLRKKMDEYTIARPISFEVNVSGKTSYQSIPLIEAFMDVNNNKVGTPKGSFEDCSFKGRYLNEYVKGKGRTDENSILEFNDFSGRWENIGIRSRNILISNLITPFLESDVLADADMQSLNSLAGSSSFQFKKGKLSMNVQYRGSVMGKDSVAANINGTVSFKNASIHYLPRNFNLDDCTGNLKFVNNDLFVNRITATAGKTKLVMTGTAKNFLSMLNVSPEKLILDWKITSPALHLQDFRGFLAKSRSKKTEKKNAKFGSTASKVDKMFAEGDMYIQLQAPLMDYKTFESRNVLAKVVLKPDEMSFEKVTLNHANGSMDVHGSLKNGATSNPVHLNAVLRNMDVPQLFTAFNNFGQDALTSKNIKGKISANVNFNSALTNDAQLISNEGEGSVFFLLEDGELNNFEPLLEISKKAFKKQDFSQIRFADLKNRLDIKGTAFIINPMEIRSTALNFTVEGVYDIKKGTDMSIRFPLNNLTRSQANADISDGGKIKKGVSLRLRARTGTDGKLKVSWDPFKKSLKKKEEVKDSAEAKR